MSPRPRSFFVAIALYAIGFALVLFGILRLTSGDKIGVAILFGGFVVALAGSFVSGRGDTPPSSEDGRAAT